MRRLGNNLQVSPQNCWHRCPSLHSNRQVQLRNHCWYRRDCGKSEGGCDANRWTQMVSVYHPKDAENVFGPLRHSCCVHGSLFSLPWAKTNQTAIDKDIIGSTFHRCNFGGRCQLNSFSKSLNKATERTGEKWVVSRRNTMRYTIYFSD